ncbi:MAG: thioredoxin-disulfide reductase [Chloroflexi bacterium]|nr:thioredoxin-disulfide reductase [Chloroflexota bacterium]
MVYATLIIGGGPGGLTAGLYAARAGLSVALLEKGLPGGQISTTFRVENYPGFPEGIGGPELGSVIEQQAAHFGVQIVLTEVTGVELGGQIKLVGATNGDYRGRTVIVATGANPAALNVPGEEQLRGRGVSYCATCDGAFFRGKDVAVVGGGDAAVEEALFLTRLARKVTIVHRRDALRATKVAQDRAFADPKIEFRWDTVVDEILGQDEVRGLALHNVKTGARSELAVEGVFIYVGMRPNTQFLGGQLALDAQGYIITNEEMETNVPGVFAVGDVRRKRLRQVVTAVADGAIAATAADAYLRGDANMSGVAASINEVPDGGS